MSVDDDDSLTDAESLDAPSLELEPTTNERRRASMERTVARASKEHTAARPVEDHYRVLEPLGRGGMGEVLAAQDEVLGRNVAIKRMLDDDADDAKVARFLREARIQARLDHPAIPPVHELARDRTGRPYFVMKRLSGTSLSDVLKQIDARDQATLAKFPRQRLLRAFADVCLAVEFAHSRGVIHRDLKPANIMLGDYGETYVIDWGIAKVVGDTDPALSTLRDSPPEGATRAGAMLGTPAYMAPEQRMSATDVDGRADIFSLGCILFDILGGRFVDRAELALAPARRPSKYLTDVAPELDDACAIATAEDRDRRLMTARDLGERVQAYLDGDRDLAMRTDLAAGHLKAAHAALAAGDDPRAMREAGRALSLDPKQAGAAQLITRLMLEPPRETPPDVTARLAAEDDEAVRTQARTATFGYVGYVMFMAFFLLMGVETPGYLVAMTLVLVALTVAGIANARSGFHPARRVVVIAGNTLLIALMARMLTPFTIAPGLATVTGMVLLTSPMFRDRRSVIAIPIAFSAACLVPFLLEVTGVLSATMIFTGDSVVLMSPAIAYPPVLTMLGLATFALVFIFGGVILARYFASANADAKLRIHLQAWRLRQLV